jgi:hypothetical protein
MQDKGHPDYRGDDLVGDDAETLTEFSKMTNESDVKKDENILDLKLMAADYFLDAFKQVQGLDQYQNSLEKSLITVVTVDFYNHSTETS